MNATTNATAICTTTDWTGYSIRWHETTSTTEWPMCDVPVFRSKGNRTEQHPHVAVAYGPTVEAAERMAEEVYKLQCQRLGWLQ